MNTSKNLTETNSYSRTQNVMMSKNKIYSRIGKLLQVADDLKESGCLNVDFSLELSKIIVCGPPSSGKSSLIESLIGIDFLPKGEDSVTRRPIEIKLVNLQNNNSNSYAEFHYEEGLTGLKFDDFSKVKTKLTELIEKKSPKNSIPSKDAIKMSIYSNSNPELTIVDLPGADHSFKNSKDICFNYIKDESSIIIYVYNANNESLLKNFSPSDTYKSNPLLKLIQEVDKNFNRTLGVFTKVDLLQSSNKTIYDNENMNLIKKILSDKDENSMILKNGFVVVKNRGENDNTSVEDNLFKEKAYFTSHSAFRNLSISDNFTVECLADKIKKLLYSDSRFRKNLNFLNKVLKDKIQQCQKELLKFGTDYIGYTNDTKNTYATSLVNSLCEAIDRSFSGKMSSNASDNLASHKLKEVYYNFLKSYVHGAHKSGYQPADKIKNEEIIRIIKLTEGDRLSGFPESEVIYSLLENDMDTLREHVKSYIDQINDIVRENIKEIILRIFCRFPKLLNRIEELMNAFLDEVNY